MDEFPKFLLDSGDPDEFRKIAKLAKEKGSEIWGATTNPTLIAKKLANPSTKLRVSREEAFELQKQIVLQIIDLVPGAVSAEVYADEQTTAEEMIGQGREIASWHERVVVKLPTTIEGFKARTALRQEKISINNTLVFSQQQIFAICLHERIIHEEFGPIDNLYPPFISPFVGRLDDQNEDGMAVVEEGMELKRTYGFFPWMLQASIRRVEHLKRGMEAVVELITAPAQVYQEWFALSDEQIENLDLRAYAKGLTPTNYWTPPPSLLAIPNLHAFMNDLISKRLDISHPLTEAGLRRFAQDWKSIITT